MIAEVKEGKFVFGNYYLIILIYTKLFDLYDLTLGLLKSLDFKSHISNSYSLISNSKKIE